MSLLLAACIVLAVHDGDTLTAQCPQRVRPLVLRIAEIDAPEYPAFTWGMQPGAQAARAEAIRVCPVKGGADVRLEKFDSRTRRWIAHVACAGIDLSHDMVATGNAWSYIPDKGSSIPALQKAAQQQQVGIWAAGLPTPIQPSVWRHSSMHQQ